VPVDELPEEMRAMTLEQRKAHIEVQRRAAEVMADPALDAQRRAHITAEVACRA
jgi:hypothetical protein